MIYIAHTKTNIHTSKQPVDLYKALVSIFDTSCGEEILTMWYYLPKGLHNAVAKYLVTEIFY